MTWLRTWFGRTPSGAPKAQKRGRARWLILPGLIALLVFAVTQVDVTVTERDKQAIETLGVTAACRQAKGDFAQEIGCFRRTQERMDELVPDKDCVHRWGEVSHEPADVLARRKGCCYSRSRLIEKTLEYAGYQVRHVSLYQRTRAIGILDFVLPAQSHSTTEVLSSKGWVVVDSNYQFVPVTADGQPLTARALRERFESGQNDAIPGSFLQGNYHIAYGLYSRHGGFYRPYVPLPDIGWRDALYNLWDRGSENDSSG